ncbi:helicase-associated domain-containing protein [Actinomadura sp. ATCC 31491]|uniref:Helicase-associated domain-containing protein n=1 Tax=Actinomadura luzonensis TaxID=2805427 RepID=A0ABT0FYG5_9ACTN|nr:helicase-associated domain-containing protein [Actinomadura luzonensis]MCK2217188.1 helicase-associated domain-containing protein [Actinomadura luzonensis]
MLRTAAELAALIEHRPELAMAPSVAVVERLLARPELAVPALLDLDADCHVVSQAVQAAGGATTRPALAAALDDPKGRLGEVLATLASRGLLLLDGESVRSPHRPGLWEHPLALGRPLRELAEELTADALRALVVSLGGRPRRRKAELASQAEELLRDGAAVRARAARLPRQAADLLRLMATEQPVLESEQIHHGGPWARAHPLRRLVEDGFVVSDGWAYEMPREVALALRGDGWKPALTGPPDVTTRPLHTAVPLPSAPRTGAGGTKADETKAEETEADGTEADGTGAALVALDRVEALVELATTAPVSELKAGGVGTRELRRVAKALGVTDQEATLWLDVAHAAGLLASDGGERLTGTTLADDWLSRSPAARWRALAAAWHRLAQAPTFRVVGCCEGHMDALAPPYPFDSGAGAIRRAVLDTLRTLPPGVATDAPGVMAAVRWRTRAAAESPPAAESFAAAALREGDLLGLTAGGALTLLGRTYLTLTDTPDRDAPDRDGGDPLDGLFPVPTRTATLQNDLTAIVPGLPSPGLAALLNACADLESRDRASVWRFSERSVRRALDTGLDAEALLDGLARHSTKAVPQPLRYLVTDTARKHGTLRVAAAPSVVVAADPATLAGLCRAKALRKLALHQVAPTVALSALPPEETLRLLRQAGHAPVGMAADGTIRAEAARRHRLPVDAEPVPDPAATAAAILRGDAAPDGTAEALALAAATGGFVVVTWQRREHVMDAVTVTGGTGTGGTVSGFCHDCGRGHTFDRARVRRAYLP